MVIPVNPNQPDRRDAGAFTARASRRKASGATKDLHCAIPDELHKWLRREAVERETTIGRLVIEAVNLLRAGAQE